MSFIIDSIGKSVKGFEAINIANTGAFLGKVITVIQANPIPVVIAVIAVAGLFFYAYKRHCDHKNWVLSTYKPLTQPKNLDTLFPNSHLISDIVVLIFIHMDFKSLRDWSQLNKQWNAVANDPYFSKPAVFNQFAFNPNHWNQFYGKGTVATEEIDEAYQLLPSSIIQTLNQEYFKNKLFHRYFLVWIPKKINKQTVTIEKMISLLEQKFGSSDSYFWQMRPYLKDTELKESTQPGWVLIGTDASVQPNNLNVPTAKFCAGPHTLVKELNKNGPSSWRNPNIGDIIIGFSTKL